MSKPAERYRQSDVSFWGIAAIAVSGFAVTAASLPAILPSQVFSALHSSQLNGADINSLRAEIASLSDEAAKLRIDNAQMLTRLSLAEKDRVAVVQRVGALENTLPLLVEQIPPGAPIDAGIVTSSVGQVTQSSDIAGGSVEITRSPLYPADPSTTPAVDTVATPMPAETTTTPKAAGADPALSNLDRVSTESFGIAMGNTVSVSEAYTAWIDLRNKVGALLIGMEPILSGEDGGYHIVVGPVDRIARAEELCGYVQRAGLQCLPVPYSGYKLPK